MGYIAARMLAFCLTRFPLTNAKTRFDWLRICVRPADYHVFLVDVDLGSDLVSLEHLRL